MVRTTLIFAILFCGCTQHSETPTPAPKTNPLPKSPATEPPATGLLDDKVSIKFSELNYSFPIAEVAQGIEIDYEIVVRDDVAKILPLSQHSQSNIRIDLNGADHAQKCVLEPFARLSGNTQFYGEFSGGCLGAPRTISPTVLQHGRYSHTFKWSGRNLSNDGGGGSLPYGAPFPPGKYVLNIRCIGQVVEQGIPKDFQITNNVTVTLTD
ncbi:MAG: hypothetical protein COA78_33290 [Blastopirellula sp.]|nr:MAG: hypothetical protein COA78_33290 [Blastopirellula sp.]